MNLVTILLHNGKAFLVGVKIAVNIGLIELQRLNICSLAFCCVYMSHFVITIFITEKSDARTQ